MLVLGRHGLLVMTNIRTAGAPQCSTFHPPFSKRTVVSVACTSSESQTFTTPKSILALSSVFYRSVADSPDHEVRARASDFAHRSSATSHMPAFQVPDPC